ncbi:MAG: hypothetical protein ACJ0Q3_10735 [Candidatus Azotimanducaceae bacterium]
MSDVVNFGAPLDRPNTSRSIKAFSFDRPDLTQSASESIDDFKSTVTDGIEVILSTSQSQGSHFT